ncbi:MAG: response regulator [FCB group bacterium]|nr:response regulator [FCB group bacterium]
MKLGNIRIGYRLGLGFAAILVLTGILGFIAQRDVTAIWRLTEEMYRHPFTVAKAVRDIRTDIIAMHRSMKDVALAENGDEIRTAKTKVDERERQVFKSFDIVFDRFLGDMSEVRDAYDTFVNWKPIRDEVIQLRLSGKKEQAAAITKGKGADYIANLDQKILTMMAFANQKAESYYTDAQIIKDETIRNTILILSAIVLLSLLVAFMITRSITKPLGSMVETSKKFVRGDYSVRNKGLTTDEAGTLARAINELADSIESRIGVQKGITEVSKSMIGRVSLQEFGKRLLKRLMNSTEANMSVFYILDKTKAKYTHLTAIGANEELLKPFSAENPEGEFGKAVTTKEISYIRNIPEETIFKFITTAGEVIPKEIITIPITVNNTVAALISLVSVHPFKAESIDIIKHSMSAINTSYSELLANEQTRVLAESLSRSNEQLEAQTEELQSQTEELQSQTEELLQQTEELEESNRELDRQKKFVEEANRLKSEFLSNMSHELRTPLNSILSLSKVLALQTADRLTEEEADYLKIVERNGRHLLELINDILDLSKIEAGQMEVQPIGFSLAELIENTVETIKPLADGKGITIDTKLPEKLPQVTTDEFLVHRILQNIIGNAVKFTEKGGVSVTIKFNKDQVFIVVKDTGIGIQAENLPHLFDEFRQVDGSPSRRFEGTGLGLAIAKRSAILLGGDILVESTVGKGSTFTIILPTQISGKHTDQDRAFSLPAVKASGESLAREPIRLLLVEDQEPIALQLTAFLKQAGYKVAVAGDGREAIDYCQTTIPDGMILDLMMPGMDGFQVLEILRNQKATAHLPVLILTAKDLTNTDRKRLRAYKIRHMVQKGDIDQAAFLKKIEAMFRANEKLSDRSVKRNRQGIESDRPSILIVDDNQDNLIALKALLKSDYTILEAVNGEEGLRMIEKHHPDLVLMDIMLPKMDGVTVLKKVREDKTLADIPMVALTGKAMKGDREQLLSAGFDDYISKPVRIEALSAKIKSLLTQTL